MAHRQSVDKRISVNNAGCLVAGKAAEPLRQERAILAGGLKPQDCVCGNSYQNDPESRAIESRRCKEAKEGHLESS